MRPVAPVVGVGGLVVKDGCVLLIRRGKAPLKGRWSVPGGTVELGETLQEALVREMREETGLEVEPLEVMTVFDRIERDAQGVLYHYVIVDFRCRHLAGEAVAGSDAEAAAWAGVDDLDTYDLPAKARELAERALATAADQSR